MAALLYSGSSETRFRQVVVESEDNEDYFTVKFAGDISFDLSLDETEARQLHRSLGASLGGSV